jgi:hypothetical protein
MPNPAMKTTPSTCLKLKEAKVILLEKAKTSTRMLTAVMTNP